MTNEVGLSTSLARVRGSGGSPAPRLEPNLVTDVRQAPSVQPEAARAQMEQFEQEFRSAGEIQRLSNQQFQQNLERQREIQLIEAEKKLSEIQLRVQQTSSQIAETADPSQIQKLTLEAYDKISQQSLGDDTLSTLQKRALAQSLRETRATVGTKAFNIQREVESEEARFAAEQKVEIDRKIVFNDPSLLNAKIEEIDKGLDSLSALSQNEKARLEDGLKSSLTSSAVVGLIEQNPETAFERLRAGEFDKNLSLESLQTLKADAADRIELQQSQAQEKVESLRSRIDADMSVRIKTGPIEQLPTRTELNELRNNGRLTDSQWEQHVISLNRRREKQRDNVDVLQMGRAFVESGLPVNTANKRAVEGFNRYYESIQPTLAELDPQRRNIEIASIIKRNKVVPDLLKGEFRIATRTSDTETIKRAADLYDTVAQEAPHMVNHLGTEKELNYIRQINRRINTGSTPEQSIQAVQQIQQRSRNPEMKKRMADAAKTLKPREQVTDVLGGVKNVVDVAELILPGSIIDTADIVSTRTIDEAALNYRLKFEETFALTDDEDLAKERAAEHVKGTYGRSVVNGDDIVMRFPPESKYAIPNIDNGWMRKQAIAEAKKIAKEGLFAPETMENFESRLRVVPVDGMTNKTWAQNRPGYDLQVIGSNGIPISLLRSQETGDLFFFDPQKAREEALEKAQSEDGDTRLVPAGNIEALINTAADKIIGN